MVDEALALDCVRGTSSVGFGLKVRSAGAVPAGRVCAANSGAPSASLARTPGLCYGGSTVSHGWFMRVTCKEGVGHDLSVLYQGTRTYSVRSQGLGSWLARVYSAGIRSCHGIDILPRVALDVLCCFPAAVGVLYSAHRDICLSCYVI